MRPCGWGGAAFALLVWVSAGRLVCGYGLSEETKTVLLREAEFDVMYEDTVTSHNQTVYAFNYTLFRNMTEGLRVSVKVLSNVSHSPIQFVLRQRHSVTSFPVPLIIRGMTYVYSHVERTLCPPPTVTGSEDQSMFVDVWSLRSHSTQYQLRVSRVDNFTLETDKKLNFTASPSQPQFFKYDFPDGVDRVVVKVTSQMKFPCSVLSIQDIKCPVYDLDNNVDFTGRFQTITKLGAITVQREDFPSNSFYVVVVVKSEDTVCGDSTDSSVMDADRIKILEVVVSPSPQSGLLAVAMVIFCAVLLLCICVPILVVECITSKKRRESVSMTPPAQETFESLDSQTMNMDNVKDPEALSDASITYLWNIGTIAVFYALPVFQFVITYQTFSNVTGNQDICYSNFLCAYPLLALSSFNNILSNLGYGLLGLLFLGIVLMRAITHKRALACKDSNALENGVQKHFGLFYALGTALMMEGLLSGCYHICPNYTNFQFDTSFMYMIAGLSMFQLYQKRHPDISENAHAAYYCLALVVFVSVIGVVLGNESIAFWIIFSVIHIVASLPLSAQLYYTDTWRGCIRRCTCPIYIHRMVFLVLANVANFLLAGYGLIKRPNDFNTHLLIIAICNLLLYLFYYIFMKLWSKETITWLGIVCIVLTAIVWGFALYFFRQGLTSWQKTPAESRENNKDCILFSFFDDHDIWHFLSSIAMFGSFMVLLTVDDDLDTVKRASIPVF